MLHRHSSERKYIFTDHINRWSGSGNNEFSVNLDKASKENIKVSPDLLTLKNLSNPQLMQVDADASKLPKKFNAKTDWIGTIIKMGWSLV